MKVNTQGFTLVEIMIVVAIIALGVIAIPNLIKARTATVPVSGVTPAAQVDGSACCFCQRADSTVEIATTGTPMHRQCLRNAALGSLEASLFPNQKSICTNNKLLIYDAIDQWALASDADAGAHLNGETNAIAHYIKGDAMPVCKTGNSTYTLLGHVSNVLVWCTSSATDHNTAAEQAHPDAPGPQRPQTGTKTENRGHSSKSRSQ